MNNCIKIFLFCSLIFISLPLFAKTLYKAKNSNDYIQLIKISGTNNIKIRVNTKGQSNVDRFFEYIHIDKAAKFNDRIIPNSDGTFDSTENDQGKERKCVWFNPDKKIWDSLNKEDFAITIYTDYDSCNEYKKLIEKYANGEEIKFTDPLKIEYKFENDELVKYIYFLEKEETKESHSYYSETKIKFDQLKLQKTKVTCDNIINFKEITMFSENNKKKEELKENSKKMFLEKIVKNPSAYNSGYEDEIFEEAGYDYVNLDSDKALDNFRKGEWICSSTIICRIISNEEFIFSPYYNVLYNSGDDGHSVFYGKLEKCCRKIDEIWEYGIPKKNGRITSVPAIRLDVAGVIVGSYTFTTMTHKKRTIPKVNIYAMRLSKY